MQPVPPESTKGTRFQIVWETAGENQHLVTDSSISVNRKLDNVLVESNSGFKEQMKSQLRFWNAFSIYAAFLQTITGATHRSCYRPFSPTCDAEWKRPNGTVLGISKLYTCSQTDKSMSPICQIESKG
jgi:hypothetical protein